MKKYQSHKIVHGGLIIGVETGALTSNPVIIHVQGVNKPFRFEGSFIARGTPVKNESYLVLYNKGTEQEYYAWCPKDIFEDGNHPADEDEPVVTLQITDRRVLQQIRDDAMDLVNTKSGDSTDCLRNTWLELSLAADRLDAMMARAEVDLEIKRSNGEVVDAEFPARSQAAQTGRTLPNKASSLAVERLKSADLGAGMDFKTVWIPTDKEGLMVISAPQESGFHVTRDIENAMHFDFEEECDSYCRNRWPIRSVSYRVNIDGTKIDASVGGNAKS